MKTDLKKLRDYEITIDKGYGETKIIVAGYRIIIDGYEDIEFFVHRSYPYGLYWHVSEQSSGRYIASAPSRKEAIQSAVECLNVIPKDVILNKIKEHNHA